MARIWWEGAVREARANVTPGVIGGVTKVPSGYRPRGAMPG